MRSLINNKQSPKPSAYRTNLTGPNRPNSTKASQSFTVRVFNHLGNFLIWYIGVASVVVLFSSAEKQWITTQPQISWEFANTSSLINENELLEVAQDLHGFPLSVIREDIINLTWVRDASVRLHWPHTYDLVIVPQVPIALIDGDIAGKSDLAKGHKQRLLSDRGRVLHGPFPSEATASLPVVYASHWYQDGNTLRPEEAQKLHFAISTFVRIGTQLEAVQISEVGAWRLLEKSGSSIKLGSEDFYPRLDRLEALVRSGKVNLTSVKTLDMRYPNGVAVTDGV